MDILLLLIQDPRRWAVMALLACLSLLAARAVFAQVSQPTEARVDLFSPQGTAKGARQVTARFSEPLVAFGDSRGPEPFTITCSAPGRARWVDSRNWAYDFDNDLPGGIECRFVLKPDLKTLAGHALGGETAFTFNTGGPGVIQSFPGNGEVIEEKQIFVLTLDAEAVPGTIRDHVHCIVQGEAKPRDIELLTGQRRAEALAMVGKTDSPQVVAVQCRQALPSGTRPVTLSWGAGVRATGGIATHQAQSLTFAVRPPFTAHVECHGVANDRFHSSNRIVNQCHPERPVRVVFSAPVTAEQASTLRLRGPNQSDAPALVYHKKQTVVESIWFNGPFPEKSVFAVEAPADLTDASGRLLTNARQFPVSVTIGQAPSVIELNNDAILESRIGGILPVLLRHIEDDIPGRWLALSASADPATGQRPDPAQQDQAIMQWLQRIRTTTKTRSLLDEQLSIHPFTVPKPASRLEVAGIPLAQPGFYVVELENPGFRVHPNGSGIHYLTTTALVTNLSVQFKTGNEGPSLVWVTTLDDAQPAKGAAVAIHDVCNGKRLWRGRTGEDGIARIDAALPLGSSHVSCKPQGLFITARLENDLSFTVATNHQYQYLARSTSSPTVHTIFDRTLFRAGETVSMKHILRRAVLAGFAIPEDGRPTTVTITHTGSDESYELPLRWDQRGIAESVWTIPRDAKLGRYSVKLSDLSPEHHEFEVAEFRTPTMTARIEPPKEPLVSAGETAVGVAVSYFGGGPAADWPVALRARVEQKHDFEALKDYANFRFNAGDLDVDAALRVCNPASDSMRIIPFTLNSQGAAQARLPNLPKVCEPHDLIMELDYQDANGERLSVSQGVPLWPARIQVGIQPFRSCTKTNALILL